MYKPDEVKEGVKKVNLKVFPKFPASFSFVYALLYYFWRYSTRINQVMSNLPFKKKQKPLLLPKLIQQVFPTYMGKLKHFCIFHSVCLPSSRSQSKIFLIKHCCSYSSVEIHNTCFSIKKWISEKRNWFYKKNCHFIFVVIAMGFIKKNWKNSFIGTYTWIFNAVKYKKWVFLEQESHLNVKKYLSLSKDFGNWRKYLIMVFELLVSLCTATCSNFIIFKILVAQEHYYHFKKCIKSYMLNRQHLIIKSNLSKI